MYGITWMGALCLHPRLIIFYKGNVVSILKLGSFLPFSYKEEALFMIMETESHTLDNFKLVVRPLIRFVYDMK